MPQAKPVQKLNDSECRDLFRCQFQRTQPCRFFMQGRCRRGANCTFAHGQVEDAPDLTKTSLCKRWMKGSCPHSSEECGFAHGHKELRHTPLFTKVVNQKVCSLMSNGKKASPASTTCSGSDGADNESRSSEEKDFLDFMPMKVNLPRFDSYAPAGDSVEPLKVTEVSSLQFRPFVLSPWTSMNQGYPSESSQMMQDSDLEHCLLDALHLAL